MGSISYPLPDGATARTEVANHVRQNGRGTVVASNSAPGDGGEWGGVYFAAHRLEDGQTWASITLFAQRKGHVFIKMMTESMNPTAIGVGPRVLAALTDTDSDDAKQWRADGARYQQRRAAALAARGKKIILAAPITLSGGPSIDTVTVMELRLWKAPWGSRIRPWWDWFMSDWTVAED